jgi:hypothetical protein
MVVTWLVDGAVGEQELVDLVVSALLLPLSALLDEDEVARLLGTG